MLSRSFIHLPGIGTKTEQKIWESGIHSWQDWRETAALKLPNSSKPQLSSLIKQSQRELERGPHFFSKALPANEQWRLFSHFRDCTAYLDIETTGLGPHAEITTIALYDGKEVYCYVNGRNLDDFINDIQKYDVLVTYNGKGFDIPMIERWFHIKLPQAHIDLRYILARLGFKGGLKGCEKQLGIDRGELDGVDGYFAVLLWQEYQRSHNEAVLETLLAYNVEDTVNLEILLIEAYNRNVSNTPFGEHLLVEPPRPPKLRHRPHREVVAQLSGHDRW